MIAFLVTGFSQLMSQQGNPELLKIVQGLGDKMEKLVVAKDLDAIVDMYGDDARYLPDAEQIFTGKAAIKGYWEKTFAMDIKGFQMTTTSVGGTRDFIHETGLGASKLNYNGQIVEFKFKFVNVWQRMADGSYKLIVDIYNRDVPAQ